MSDTVLVSLVAQIYTQKLLYIYMYIYWKQEKQFSECNSFFQNYLTGLKVIGALDNILTFSFWLQIIYHIKIDNLPMQRKKIF